ncbi:MAG: hypothetical protein QUS14_04605, partial [Pyrinomonadaceae bacterium]|nr:hypothetical protein [Pyrinomonadaceae bacterium]
FGTRRQRQMCIRDRPCSLRISSTWALIEAGKKNTAPKSKRIFKRKGRGLLHRITFIDGRRGFR